MRDKGSAEAVRARLKDDDLAVRATAIYALGRIAGPAAAAELRAATNDALAHEKQHGQSEFDLRETLQQALAP